MKHQWDKYDWSSTDLWRIGLKYFQWRLFDTWFTQREECVNFMELFLLIITGISIKTYLQSRIFMGFYWGKAE